MFFGSFCFGQTGFSVLHSQKKLTIPFQLINNLIFIQVEVNSVPLTFLLDTGVSQTLFLSTGDKEVAFNNKETVHFSGLGGDLKIEGLKSNNNMVKVTNQLIDYHHTIYIILDEDFNFSSYVGIPVHGILGYDFFENHAIEIDYISKRIIVYNDEKLYQRKSRNFVEFPISIENKKPYLITEIQENKEKIAAKMLIDTGNGDAVWIFPNLKKDFIYKNPSIDDFLGRGFNGDIHGKRSRINNISIGDFTFNQPVTALPDEFSIQNFQMAENRKGSIGSEITRRFNIIFDYPNKKIKLKKNRNYDEAFRINMSGLEFKHIGLTWEKEQIQMAGSDLESSTKAENKYVYTAYSYNFVLKPVFAISGVRKDSPAYKAGLKKDDVLQSINGQSTSYLTLEKLNEMMKHDEGKNFRIEILRNDIPMKFNFYLEDPIPYKN